MASDLVATTVSATAAPAGKVPFIEVWRGIAVFLVVYYHYVDRLPYEALGASAPASLPFYSGKLGVLIFLIISGYLIAQSLSFTRTLAAFYAKRLSRLWPLFLLASVVIFVFLIFFQPPIVPDGPKQFYERPRTVIDLIGQSFFLRDLGFQWIDGVFWSILVEIKFYFWIGLIAAFRPATFARDFAIASLVITLAQFGAEFGLPPEWAWTNRLLNGLFVAEYLPFFAIGVLLFARNYGPLLTIHILLALMQAGIKSASNPNFDMHDTAVFFAVLALVIAADAWLLNSRIFLLLGEYSYSLYLFHQMIGLTIIAMLAPRLGLDLAVAITFVTMLGVAIIASKAAEWRYRKRVEQMLERIFTAIGLARFRFGREAAPRQAPA